MIGDLMAEPVGSAHYDGKSFVSLTLFEVSSVADGRGTIYTQDGTESYFKWASESRANKVDISLLPEGFLFAFKHGMWRLNIIEADMALPVHEALARSDWKAHALTPEIIAKQKEIAAIPITCFMDIARNWASLFSEERIPNVIVNKIMNLIHYRRARVVNGESGIAAWEDRNAFMGLYLTLKQWKEEGTLDTRCEALDKETSSLK